MMPMTETDLLEAEGVRLEAGKDAVPVLPSLASWTWG
jgi:hypothetical protein